MRAILALFVYYLPLCTTLLLSSALGSKEWDYSREEIDSYAPNLLWGLTLPPSIRPKGVSLLKCQRQRQQHHQPVLVKVYVLLDTVLLKHYTGN